MYTVRVIVYLHQTLKALASRELMERIYPVIVKKIIHAGYGGDTLCIQVLRWLQSSGQFRRVSHPKAPTSGHNPRPSLTYPPVPYRGRCLSRRNTTTQAGRASRAGNAEACIRDRHFYMEVSTHKNHVYQSFSTSKTYIHCSHVIRHQYIT